MGAAMIVRNRRLELGLSDVDVAERAGLSVAEFGDIELHDDELCTAVSLGVVKRLCEVLQLPLHQVFQVPKVEDLNVRDLRPEDLMRQRRELLGRSRYELADEVGFDEATIESLEDDPLSANSFPAFLLKDIETALGLPMGLLLLSDWGNGAG